MSVKRRASKPPRLQQAKAATTLPLLIQLLMQSRTMPPLRPVAVEALVEELAPQVQAMQQQQQRTPTRVTQEEARSARSAATERRYNGVFIPLWCFV